MSDKLSTILPVEQKANILVKILRVYYKFRPFVKFGEVLIINNANGNGNKLNKDVTFSVWNLCLETLSCCLVRLLPIVLP